METGLLLIAIFAGLYAGFYARRAYHTAQKIMEKLGK
jgi:hypothetical protein